MARFDQLGLGTALALGPRPAEDFEITGLTPDSRAVRPDMLFAALPGANVHGARFASAALAAGACAVLTDLRGAAIVSETDPGATVLVSDDPRRALAEAAARFYGAQPARMVAVTGTAGKSSTASFCRQLWTALGRRAVNLGTIGVEGAVARPLSVTTPEPVTLHALLADLARDGVEAAAMEASSHGLDQRRLDGVRLAAGAFLNLGRDHMDYHADAADYLAAKLGLFARALPEGAGAVVNADAPQAGLVEKIATARGLRLLRFGTAQAAELRLIGVAPHETGQSLCFTWNGQTHQAGLDLIGGFQGENALAACALLIAAGEDPEAVFAALPGLVGVKGRMEHVATRANGARIYVDYAHKPEALAAALGALRRHTPGRLAVVFGAGGDRDAGKRPLMGAAAAKAADLAFVTDDNPRSEPPGAIRAQVLAACPGAEEIGDRAEAILRAVDALGPQDRLLIAGKGHETGQIVAGEMRPFDDAEQARAAVAALDGVEAV